MQAIIQYLNLGGTWTWISFGAGALGILAVVGAFFAAYRRGPAILAAELGLLSVAAAGVGWWQIRDASTGALEAAGQKLASPSPLAAEVAAQTLAEVELRMAVPVRVGMGAGLPPLVVGMVLVMFGAKHQRRRL